MKHKHDESASAAQKQAPTGFCFTYIKHTLIYSYTNCLYAADCGRVSSRSLPVCSLLMWNKVYQYMFDFEYIRLDNIS